jgi:hypothetical protein
MMRRRVKAAGLLVLVVYAGTFEHAGYGVVRIVHENGGPVFGLDEFTVPLEHFHYDVFRRAGNGGARTPIDDARVTFSYGANGKVESVSIPLEPAAPEVVFKRQPAPAKSTS